MDEELVKELVAYWTAAEAADNAHEAYRTARRAGASDADWHNTMRVLCEALGASEVDADG